jgi:hypothetical protein
MKEKRRLTVHRAIINSSYIKCPVECLPCNSGEMCTQDPAGRHVLAGLPRTLHDNLLLRDCGSESNIQGTPWV